MKVAAIGDRGFTLIWRLVGVEPLEAESEKDFVRTFGSALRSREYSAILIPEKFLDLANEVRSKLQLERVEPILVVIPERGLGKRAGDLRRRISLAMGVEVQI